jgi:hypothetical protein
MVDISAAATSVFRPVMVMLRFSFRVREFALAAAPAARRRRIFRGSDHVGVADETACGMQITIPRPISDIAGLGTAERPRSAIPITRSLPQNHRPLQQTRFRG